MDLLDIDRIALDLNVALYAELTDDEFDRPTPCAGWVVRDVLDHQVEQTLAFAAGARLGEPRAHDRANLVEEYARAADEVTAAFRADGLLDREAEFPDFGPMPGRNLVAVHFVDNLVHYWDVTRALGRAVVLDDRLAGAAHRIASRYPVTTSVRGPGSAFAMPVAVPEGAPVGDRLVGLLGRDPAWSA
ncbi:TIGR03086 family metal-binding protein [Actinosynnema sp. NPDC020468]|uniref:TIGR03086 family metal-binding protein n=1 Tax=Actinosynnema sp. NPDC020468 TaxID=3154488 RepID=UPI0033F819E8